MGEIDTHLGVRGVIETGDVVLDGGGELSGLGVGLVGEDEVANVGRIHVEQELRGGWFANRRETDLFCEHLQNSVDAVVGMGSGSGGGRT